MLTVEIHGTSIYYPNGNFIIFFFFVIHASATDITFSTSTFEQSQCLGLTSPLLSIDGVAAGDENPFVRGWLTPRSGVDGVEAAETPTIISSLYRDDALHTLDREVICTPNMTFHDCERHKHVRLALGQQKCSVSPAYQSAGDKNQGTHTDLKQMNQHACKWSKSYGLGAWRCGCMACECSSM